LLSSGKLIVDSMYSYAFSNCLRCITYVHLMVDDPQLRDIIKHLEDILDSIHDEIPLHADTIAFAREEGEEDSGPRQE
jgi:hypothetical protein